MFKILTWSIPFINKQKLFTSYAIRTNSNWQEEVVNCLGENVYITIDLDAFDPSIMPSTGTPEPGGLLWDETLNIIKIAAKNCNIVGADINELSPIKGFNCYNFLVAKLAYKILSYTFAFKR